MKLFPWVALCACVLVVVASVVVGWLVISLPGRLDGPIGGNGRNSGVGNLFGLRVGIYVGCVVEREELDTWYDG